MTSDTALIILARYPEHGKVKTRLARDLGVENTLVLYQAFLQDLLLKFSCWHYDLHWAYTPTERDFAGLLSSWAPQNGPYCCWPQQGQDLGKRLMHAFCLTLPSYRSVLLISSDTPQLERAQLLQARKALDVSDVVLLPAEDGGYSLIGMNKPYDLFSGIPMSTDAVLGLTVKKAQQQSLTVSLLAPCFDVDNIAALRRLSALLEQNPTIAPTTAACLQDIALQRKAS
ncbi:glycosyltransferase [Ktedonosporobacter rubrisoli]|uniref:Glycosyltransferase n=1 Tax=Ktedonosporobacter rubrisoli TaxID=2509675 RepID=A0A4P6JIQ2_KTERU|nr:TIGR04282 family arsenosugar biosynthesis glycosyltransferase [Ktedonosporobacter rubrisoli]QBD74967.1 glycosyltransferase [Ktedonosporobacter rubrisoli]